MPYIKSTLGMRSKSCDFINDAMTQKGYENDNNV